MLLSIICKHSFASDDPNTIMRSVSHCGCAQPRGAVVKPFRSSGKSFFLEMAWTRLNRTFRVPEMRTMSNSRKEKRHSML